MNEIDQPHGLMFHHFYNEKHINGQGAISAHQLESIIQYYGENVLSAKDWYKKATTNSLNKNDICLTFDDALLCQYEIALPILEKYNLTAFWFVYSSVLNGEIENLEIYRKFRTACFSSIEDFYKSFFSVVDDSEFSRDVKASLTTYSHNNWSHFPFYSQNDTKFRFIRDTSLGSEKYNSIMNIMMKKHNIDIKDFSIDLWMNVEQVQYLSRKGHIIGLHSHTHPTNLSNLSTLEQKKEYEENFNFLHTILENPPKTVSHPCNSYNDQTLTILKELNIELGFRANMENHLLTKYEFPREDHANVIARMKQ